MASARLRHKKNISETMGAVLLSREFNDNPFETLSYIDKILRG